MNDSGPDLDNLADVEASIVAGLARPLPGGVAQARLAPRPRAGWMPDRVPDDARDGAALLLLYPHAGVTHVLLTLRGGNLALHAGQVSLPGGGLRPGEAAVDAALREAHEETAVPPVAVRVLGRLSPLHIPVSEYVVHPFVGVAARRHGFRAQPGEVDRLLEMPLRDLADPARLRVDSRTFRGQPFRVPWLDVNGERLWGATAMIVAEFLTLVGAPPAEWS